MSNVIEVNFRKPELKDTKTTLEMIKELRDHENFPEALKWIIYNSKDPADTYVYALSHLLSEKEMQQLVAGMSNIQAYLDLDDNLRMHLDKFFELRRMVCG